MPSKFEKTKHKGCYLRGRTYYATVTSGGVTRKIAAGRTLDDAVKLKRKLEAAKDRGEDIAAPREREKFADYAQSWIASYTGRGRQHIGERTKHEYRRDLERHVLGWIGDTQIGRIRPRTLDDLVAHLQKDTDLADATIKRILAPVKACLGDAYRHGDIANNPAVGVRVRARPQVVESDEERVKALSRAQLADLVAKTDPRWQLLIRLLACSGLRISEALALRWSDLDLGNTPSLTVRRAVKHGETEKIGVPKSRASRRTVPLPAAVAMDLRLKRAESEWGRDTDLVFCSATGTVMQDSNLRRRVLTPAAKAAGVPWAHFHTLRHTFASILIAEGRTIVQVSRLLGHSTPSFTLNVYVHLMDGDVGGALDLDAALAPSKTSAPVIAA